MARFAAAFAVLVFGGAAGASQAAVQVYGSSLAHRCMDAAFAAASDQAAIGACSLALSEQGLTPVNRAGTLVNRGVLHMNRRDHPAALADFEAALTLMPRSGEAHFNRGSVRIAQGRYAEGVADVERGLQLGMRQPEKAYYNRALAREELADAKGAYLDYQQAARLKPDWKLPRQELARFTVQRR